MEGFEKLVHELDDAALAGLTEAASKESSLRREQQSLRLEDIHPNMSAAERQRVKDHIARLLRGEE